MKKMTSRKSLVHVLGVIYVHAKTRDGGDLYLTRFAAPYEEHFKIKNWYEKDWFMKHRTRLKGTSSVYRVPTRRMQGKSLDLVVKNCRVGEDVPLDTHTLREYCDAEFNSPWEEFSLVTEMRESLYGPKKKKVKTQRPLAIYVPPEKMQPWQSGRSRAKMRRLQAKHPGIDLDILKQYKLVYEWIRGKNLVEVFEHIDLDNSELMQHLKIINDTVISDLDRKGYLVADMKPEHIIISETDVIRIDALSQSQKNTAVTQERVAMIYQLITEGRYSVVDYELLLRTATHENAVKDSRRHSYLVDQRDRFIATPLPVHLKEMEVFGVPYIYGHAESTGGHLWVVGRNARLFDYFLPERWRKTPSLKLSDSNEVFYTITKDNIHVVWRTSRVGEIPEVEDKDRYDPKICQYGINSPFEKFTIAHTLHELGIPCVYERAIYMTGSIKIEQSTDFRRYDSHKDILDPEGNPILQENHNYITIRGYYNGPDHWVAEQQGPLYVPIDLAKAVSKGIIDEYECRDFLDRVKNNLGGVGYDGSLLKANDILLALDASGSVLKNVDGDPELVICNFELIWKIADACMEFQKE